MGYDPCPAPQHGPGDARRVTRARLCGCGRLVPAGVKLCTEVRSWGCRWSKGYGPALEQKLKPSRRREDSTVDSGQRVTDLQGVDFRARQHPISPRVSSGNESGASTRDHASLSPRACGNAARSQPPRTDVVITTMLVAITSELTERMRPQALFGNRPKEAWSELKPRRTAGGRSACRSNGDSP